MHYVVYLPLALPLLAAVAARPLAGRLPPAIATWLLAGSAVVLAVTSSAVLGLLALTAVLRIPALDAAAGLSAHVLSRDNPASLPVAVAAGALLAASATAVAGALYRRATALASAFRQARRLPGARQVVVTDEDAADAYTVPGWPCRIVVTAGMMRALSADERRVLLAHERAHAAWFHYLFTSAARLAAAANPLLRPVAAAVGYTVERWADEHAAAVTGSRPLTARAVATAALATSAGPRSRTPLAALGVAARPGPVPLRVAALLRPPPQPRLLLLAAVVALVAVSGVSALEASRDLHNLLELAQAAASR